MQKYIFKVKNGEECSERDTLGGWRPLGLQNIHQIMMGARGKAHVGIKKENLK